MSPNLSVSQFYSLSPITGLPLWWWCQALSPVRLCVSSIICLSPVPYFICLRSHLSPIMCLPLWRCPVLVSSWFYLCFVLVSFLYSLCVFLLSQEKSCSTVIFSVLPLASHLYPTLSPSYCLRYCTNAVAKNRNRVAWEMLLVCDSLCSRLTWIKHCQHQELV